jgi:spermidine synthase
VPLPFEQLSWDETPMGVLGLRRRTDPTLGAEVYEVKLGDEYLMSSHFTVAEIALATLGLAALEGDGLEVVVGGLGLGYTARAVLEDPRVVSLVVVEALPEVIAWHEQALLPEVAGVASDPRTRFVQADLFAALAGGAGFDPVDPHRRFDAVLIDIDHSPRHVLHPSHAAFYTVDGLRPLVDRLRPGGVFGLWSDDPPDEGFLDVLAEAFAQAAAEVVTFDNPLAGGTSANTIYLARAAVRG